jgi:hypothetical protein
MFLTQVWGTILGGFINYVVMSSIVSANKPLLVETNGNSSWSGATLQSYNTNAASWALAKYLYTTGKDYYMVPLGIIVGASFVIAHKIFSVVSHLPSSMVHISRYSLANTAITQFVPNLPQLIQYAGYVPYNASQTCVLLSQMITGFFVQFYLRNYKPGFFKHYMYLITGAFDGGALWALFILSFAVFGAAGTTVVFPQWWGNNVKGYYDLCPSG